uniref:TAZ-type domain-containing protein n=1 Tax=Trichogramma kaykai TaxID=54128 RepID=A0ABD2W6T5_9HYME
MADTMDVQIVLEVIDITDNDDDNAASIMEVEHQAPVANDDVEVLAELPRQPPAHAPLPNPDDDAAYDDTITMDAASHDRVTDESVCSSVSAEDPSEAGSFAADSGLGESTNGYASPNEGARVAAQREQQPLRANELQVAAAPASPDPEVNRGAAVDKLPAPFDVNAWLRRVEQPRAPIAIPEQGERAHGRPEDIPLQDRQLLEYLFDGFRPDFPIVNDCDHALLWAFIRPTGAWRGICCLEGIKHYPGLREVLIHKTGLKGALREQCGTCPDCNLPTRRVIGARHCDTCTRVIVLNRDAILSRRILESSPPDIRSETLTCIPYQQHCHQLFYSQSM